MLKNEPKIKLKIIDLKKDLINYSSLSTNENFQRNYIAKGLVEASDDDWIIISDLDEIPNLTENDLKSIRSPIVFFKQLMMYYKFNLVMKNFRWIGSKACKKKDLKSPQWIRNIKDRT